ncbi:MAG: DUF4267 domain-containing protein [Hyphomonadaceae bacterium]|jgi:hypothetical protein|nr:DUF4267 domain-containing protein [Hyphomonadaceae bacterium]
MKTERWIIALSLIGGVLLTVIGIRYLLTPEGAARTFGVPGRPAGFELYYIIGLRNVWLGLMAVLLAILREWRALALWFSLGVIVCFADAGIAASSTGRWPQIAFHIGSGLASAGLAAGCWRLARRAG